MEGKQEQHRHRVHLTSVSQQFHFNQGQELGDLVTERHSVHTVERSARIVLNLEFKTKVCST